MHTPTAAGTTESGLPLRDPGANYVPGAVPEEPERPARPETPVPAGQEQSRGEPAAWDRSAEAIRQRFSANQEGRRRAMESRRR
ncbi:MAG: hypothetical protein L0I76_04900 [Pseudonocardia sp.]|nr:hypothetical protein [Pseudonocardia sp.]